MTRNLVLCAVPTVIALLAIYWFTKKKKIKTSVFDDPKDVSEQNEVHLDSSTESSPDLGNTLSDASSFASPVSSEKSLRTNSPLCSSPLPNIAGDNHLPNLKTFTSSVNDICNEDLSLVKRDENIYKFDSSSDEILKANSSEKAYSSEINSTNITDHIIDTNSMINSNIESNASFEDVKAQNVSFNKNSSLIFTKENQSVITSDVESKRVENCNETILWNNHVDKNAEDILNQENTIVDYKTSSFISTLRENEKNSENDGYSSVFDENSLSYGSDDSDGKQLIECKNKDSLSSVLDENSLFSSIADELEKTIDCISPLGILSQLDNSLVSVEDVLNLKHDEISVKCEKIENLNNSSNQTSQSFKFSEKLNVVDESFYNDKASKIIGSDVLTTIKNSSPENTAEEAPIDLDFKKIKEATSSDNSNSVQNNFSNQSKLWNKLTDLSNCNYTTFKTLASPLNHKPTLQSNSSSPELNVNGCYNFDSENSSEENGNILSSVNNSNLQSTEEVTSHLDAAASVVQRISSELNTSLTMLLGNTANQSTKEENNPSKNCTETKESLCVDIVDDTKLNCDKSTENLSSNSFDKKGETKISNDLKTSETNSSVVSNSTRRQPGDSYNWDGNKEIKHCNGTLDIKSPLQSSSEFVYEFELPQELCGRLIGKHGRSVKSIMERSNANVFIKRHPYDQSLKVVVVEGQRSDVNEALDIIRRKYPPSMFPTVTLVQTNVIGSTGVPLPESLQLHLPEAASCDVILSSLVNAGHFFLQQPTHPTYPSLSTLDQCMIGLYSTVDTPLLPQPIEAGVICAAPVFRGWYRAQVVYVSENTTECGIKFVDYGGFSRVLISSLRQIRSDFMSLPFQASECYLANVRPVGGESWSPEATSTFEELAQGQILQALLVEYADDGIPCVHLYRVQGISSTFINKELVERGLAVWVNSNHWDPH